MGKALSVVKGAVDPLGFTGDNAISDIIKGKKDPGTPDSVIDLADPTGRALQSKALGQYGDFLNQDMSGIAANQTARLEEQARASVGDQQRQAQSLVAQRGLGGTSIGLNAILGQNAELGNQLGTIRANQPMLENQLKQQNLGYATNGINSILGEQGKSKIFKQGQVSQGRQGGLLPLIGGAAGAYFGGPAGAQAGMALGQAGTQIG